MARYVFEARVSYLDGRGTSWRAQRAVCFASFGTHPAIMIGNEEDRVIRGADSLGKYRAIESCLCWRGQQQQQQQCLLAPGETQCLMRTRACRSICVVLRSGPREHTEPPFHPAEEGHYTISDRRRLINGGFNANLRHRAATSRRFSSRSSKSDVRPILPQRAFRLRLCVRSTAVDVLRHYTPTLFKETDCRK